MVLKIYQLESVVHVRHYAVDVDLAEDWEQVGPELYDLFPVLEEIDHVFDVFGHLLNFSFEVL